MKRKSVLSTLMLLVAISTSTLAQTVSQMVADWKRAKEYTQEYLDAMPADGVGYKPTPDVRSFAEQMLHLANGNYNFAAAASGKANPHQGKNLEKMEELKSKEALSKAVAESYDFVIQSLEGLKDGDMGASIKLFGRDMSRGVAYAKAFEHQTHHRGQTTTYIRMKGIKPPNEKLF
ncbi:DinB family protein [Telluribacter sp. SYSU D00476]|uniref:DinB family protein n=1 Tax=Telluribacter sp. SYSU D00476 TaxID=2811430 RepID=UPI001FF339EB|nr:DinB family protein [Telluribacter sp. SYSU D00476]